MSIKGLLKRLAAKAGILRRMRRARAIADARSFGPHDDKMKTFYAQFIPSGGIVFDVGANVGNRTKIFLALGARRVVAFEPQNECAEILQIVFGMNPAFTLVKAALGAKAQMQNMMIADISTVSSLSPDWVESAIATRRFGDVRWKGTQEVEVETIETYFAKYGVPDFVKIDVEGYELEVIRGLSRLPGYLSMEFTPEHIGRTMESIKLIEALGPGSRYRISLRESMEFSSDWTDQSGIMQALREVDPRDYGDVYVGCANNSAVE
jgi:FkbM family methyltransferase